MECWLMIQMSSFSHVQLKIEPFNAKSEHSVTKKLTTQLNHTAFFIRRIPRIYVPLFLRSRISVLVYLMMYFPGGLQDFGLPEITLGA